MDSDRKKTLIKAIQSYDTKVFREGIEGLSHISICEFLIENLSSPSAPHIYPHNPSKHTKKRDIFFKDVLEDLRNREFVVAAELVTYKLRIANISEELFGYIRQAIDVCRISQERSEIQFWAYLESLENTLDELHKKASKDLEEVVREEGIVRPSQTVVDQRTGESYDPDAASEMFVQAYGLALKLIAYKNKWWSDDEQLIAPELISPHKDVVADSREILNLAVAWRRLEDSSFRIMLFGGKIEIVEGEEVQEDARSAGISKAYHLKPKFTDFEVLDHIASRRAVERNTQHYYEAILELGAHKQVVSDIRYIENINDGKYLFEDEISSLIVLSNQFCEDFFGGKNEYLGLSVREWVRCYACLKYIGRNTDRSLFGGKFTRRYLKDVLNKGGIDNEKAEKFIDYVTFNKKSTDLYDAPLVSFGDECFYLVHSVVKYVSLSAPLISLFSSLDVEFKNKGHLFEDEINRQLKDCGIKSKSLKFNRDGEEYEYDAVFILDNFVFVCECKNRSLSGTRPIPSARFKKLMDSAANQVKRLVYGLKEYPDEFYKHFDRDLSGYEIVPMVINSQPFSHVGYYEGVYITDRSALIRFFQKRSIDYKVYSLNDKEVIDKPGIHDFWKGEQPTSDDLFVHLRMPIQIEVYLNNIHTIGGWSPPLGNVAFTFNQIFSDEKLGKDIKFGALEVKPRASTSESETWDEPKYSYKNKKKGGSRPAIKKVRSERKKRKNHQRKARRKNR